jgi:hypothetical protein
MGMKVLFLDFDGPIIPIMSHKCPRVSGKGAQAWPSCVAALNRITDATGAVIVVSSTWRADGITKTRERLKQWGVKADCIALTPYLDKKTESGLWAAVPRGLEIQKWLDDYGRHPIESFVILDDDKDMEHLMPFLIQTPFEVGLSEADADRAIEMLNTQQRTVPAGGLSTVQERGATRNAAQPATERSRRDYGGEIIMATEARRG